MVAEANCNVGFNGWQGQMSALRCVAQAERLIGWNQNPGRGITHSRLTALYQPHNILSKTPNVWLTSSAVAKLMLHRLIQLPVGYSRVSRSLGFAALITAAIGVGQHPVHAVAFIATGTVIAPTADIGKTFSLTADYTPSSSQSAVLNSATLVVGTQTWSSLLGGTSPSITVSSARDSFTIAGQFPGSTPGNVGDIFTSLSLNLASSITVPLRQATEANINALYGAQTSVLGTLTLVSGGTSPFGGPILNLQGNPLPSPPAATAPGPLPLLGAASAFGFARTLRKRLHHLN